MENRQNRKYKNRNRRYFAMGLGVGFILSFIVYLLVTRYAFKDRIYIFSSGKAGQADSVRQDTIGMETPKETYPVTGKSSGFPLADSTATDSVHFAAYDPGLEEVDFMLEVPEKEDVIASDRILASRKVKVQYKKENAETDSVNKANRFQHFDVEQWNSPIKNKMTYWRKNNALKVKGVDISRIEIIFVNGEYYMNYGLRRFILHTNNAFEKLVEAEPVN